MARIYRDRDPALRSPRAFDRPKKGVQMPASIRSRLTYANVMATLAFFVAIGGTTIAATRIDGGTIEKGTVKGKALKNATIKAKKLRTDTLTGAQIREETLAAVPRATVADSAGSAQNAQSATTLGGRTASQLTDDCPPSTSPYAGVCIETVARTAATWPDAAEICGDAGGRLPGLEELEGFRSEPGIALTFNAEHTSSYLDFNDLAGGGGNTVAIYDNGSLTPGHDYGNSYAAYRCVFPSTNR
jgi:hypothetical protein